MINKKSNIFPVERGINQKKKRMENFCNNALRLPSFLAHLSLKAQVSFSDHLSSVVCLSVRPSVRPSVCKLFTFSSSSPEPLVQFQPNLTQSILGWRGFKFVQMKGPALFQGQIITKLWKYIDEIKKSSSPEPLGQFQPNLAQSILGWRGFKFVQLKGPALFQGEIITK